MALIESIITFLLNHRIKLVLAYSLIGALVGTLIISNYLDSWVQVFLFILVLLLVTGAIPLSLALRFMKQHSEIGDLSGEEF